MKGKAVDISKLQERLSSYLPGWDAQKKMAPVGRRHIPPADAIPIESAVLVLLVEDSDDYAVVFIHRTEDGGPHSGQISFPGGRREPQDKTLMDTALREAAEEIALNCNHVNILGQLTPLYLPLSNFMIYPFVALADGCDDFYPQPEEVQKVIKIRLSCLMNDDYKHFEVFQASNEAPIEAPAFCVGETKIWGATAMILSELCEMLSSMNDE